MGTCYTVLLIFVYFLFYLLIFLFIIFIFVFSGPYSRHMEVPRLGIESEL